MIGTLGSAKQSPQTYATPHSGLFFSALFNAFPLAQTAHAQEPAVDISVGQAVFPDGNLLPSQPIVYSLFITNNSAISLSGIIVSDVVPREIVSTTIINTPNGSTILELSGYPTYSWQIDNLDAFSRVDIYVIGRLASDLSQPAALENKLIGSVAETATNPTIAAPSNLR